VLISTKKRTKKAAFYSIAARLETEVTSPAALLVTSALEIDGTMMVASQVADALVDEGYQVALIDAAQDTENERSNVARPLIFGGSTGTSIETLPQTYTRIAIRDLPRFAGSRRDIAQLVDRLRTNYDYVIVSAPSFNDGSLPMLFASVCDAMIVAVVINRQATEEDKALNGFLDTTPKPVVAVVSTSKAAIATFDFAAKYQRRSFQPVAEPSELIARAPVANGSV